MKAILLAGAFLLCQPAVIAQAAPVTHEATGIEFPDQIAEFKRGNVYDYEAKQPGLGFSYAYNTGKGTIATVYVYTLGLPYVPPSVDYPVMGQLRQQTVGEIVGFAKQRNETAKQVE